MRTLGITTILCFVVAIVSYSQTRTVAPRATGEGSLGAADAKWAEAHVNTGNFDRIVLSGEALDSWSEKEDALGNPGVDDYVLSSKVDGTRSWVENAGGGGGTFTNLFAGAGTTGSVWSTSADTNKYLRGDGTWQDVAGGASLTNELGATITHATTNETSTSETEVLTAGAVARGRVEMIELVIAQTANQTIVNNTATILNHGTNATAYLATTSGYESSIDTANNRIYLPKIGRWRVGSGNRVQSAAGQNSFSVLRYSKDGATSVAISLIQTQASFHDSSLTTTIRSATTNDYLESQIYQNSGESRNTTAALTYMYAIWEGY